MLALYKNDNAIEYLKNEFKDLYLIKYEKIIEDMRKHGDRFLYHVYKNLAIVNLTTIYELTEYEKWLEANKIKTQKLYI